MFAITFVASYVTSEFNDGLFPYVVLGHEVKDSEGEIVVGELLRVEVGERVVEV